MTPFDPLAPRQDWRGKTIAIGDTVCFTRGTSSRHFASGVIEVFTLERTSTGRADTREYALIRIGQESSHYRYDKKRASRVLVQHLTRVEP